MRVSVAVALILLSAPARAFTTLYDCENRWPASIAEYRVSDDVTELAGVATSLDELRDIYRRSFAVWSAPCCSSMEARELGVTAASALDVNDDVNALTIITEDWPAQLGNPEATIGVTIVVIDEDCGITSADTLFNATTFVFSNGGEGLTVDFEAVAVHELGHFVGLGHTNVEGATMFPAYTGVGDRTLHPDDEDGVCSLYPRECGCRANIDCPGTYDCVRGTCFPKQRSAPPACPFNPDCPVCAPCSSDEDCGEGGLCFGDGRCTVFCEDPTSCPGDSLCFETELGNVCFNPDAANGDLCPDDYLCGGECGPAPDTPPGDAGVVVDAGPAAQTLPPRDVGCNCGGSGEGALALLLLSILRFRRKLA